MAIFPSKRGFSRSVLLARTEKSRGIIINKKNTRLAPCQCSPIGKHPRHTAGIDNVCKRVINRITRIRVINATTCKRFTYAAFDNTYIPRFVFLFPYFDRLCRRLARKINNKKKNPARSKRTPERPRTRDNKYEISSSSSSHVGPFEKRTVRYVCIIVVHHDRGSRLRRIPTTRG